MNGAVVKVEIGPWVNAGWKMFTSHWQTWVKMACLAFLPMIIPMIGVVVGYFGVIASLIPHVAFDPYGQPYPQMSAGVPVWAFTILGGSMLLAMLAGFISLYFGIGMWKAALKQARGGIPEMSDLRGNGHLFWKVFLAQLVVGLLTMVGIMLCYIPGFIVMAWYYYVIPLVIDKELGLGEAMERSKAVTSQQLLMFILWAFVVSILASLGAYVCYIGVVATIPLQFTMAAASYCASYEGANYGTPAPAYPPPAAPPSASY